MVPRFALTETKGGIVEAGKLQGPILGTSDRIIRLGHVRRNRSREHYKGGKSI